MGDPAPQQPDRPLDEATKRRLREETAREQADVVRGRSNWLRRKVWGLLALTGMIATGASGYKLATNDGGAPDPLQQKKTAKDALQTAREDAKPIVDAILRDEETVRLRTVTDADVQANLRRVLEDKNVSPEELWETLRQWQEAELLAIARRYRVVDGAQQAIDASRADPRAADRSATAAEKTAACTDPEAYAKRLPQFHAAARQLGQQMTRDPNGALATRWHGLVNALCGADAAEAKQACALMQQELAPTLPFSADAVVTVAQAGGLAVNATGRERLLQHELQQLAKTAVERHELLGQAESYSATLRGVRTLSGIHKKSLDAMRTAKLSTAAGEKAQAEIEARQQRIDAAGKELAAVVTAMTLRNAAFDNPQYRDASEAAIATLFGKDVPPRGQTLNRLYEKLYLAMDNLRAQLNNKHPDCAEAEKVLRRLAYAVQQRGNIDEAAEQANNFLKRTEGVADEDVRAARALIEGLAKRGGGLTVDEVRSAYRELAKRQQLPFGQENIELHADWANQHKQSIKDPTVTMDPARRAEIAKSRAACLRGIAETMRTLLTILNERERWQSGFSAVQNRIEAQGPDNAFISNTNVVGDLEEDMRAQMKKAVGQIREFSRDAEKEHSLSDRDIQRDAARKAVNIIRAFMHVVDRLRLQPGQNTPLSVEMEEIVRAYDVAPLRSLLESHEMLLALVENESTGSTAKIAADRRQATDTQIEQALEALQREHKGTLTLPQLQQLLQRELTPAQRLALRLWVERLREQRLRPFLTEETANLEALAAQSTEGAQAVGEMQHSGNSWIWTLALVLGILATYKGGRGWIAAKFAQSAEGRQAYADAIATLEAQARREEEEAKKPS